MTRIKSDAFILERADEPLLSANDRVKLCPNGRETILTAINPNEKGRWSEGDLAPCAIFPGGGKNFRRGNESMAKQLPFILFS